MNFMYIVSYADRKILLDILLKCQLVFIKRNVCNFELYIFVTYLVIYFHYNFNLFLRKMQIFPSI